MPTLNKTLMAVCRYNCVAIPHRPIHSWAELAGREGSRSGGAVRVCTVQSRGFVLWSATIQH